MKYTILFLLFPFIIFGQNDTMKIDTTFFGGINSTYLEYLNPHIVTGEYMINTTPIVLSKPMQSYERSTVIRACNTNVSANYSSVFNSINCTLEADQSIMVNCINVHVLGKGTPISVLGQTDVEFKWDGKKWITRRLEPIEIKGSYRDHVNFKDLPNYK